MFRIKGNGAAAPVDNPRAPIITGCMRLLVCRYGYMKRGDWWPPPSSAGQ